jgi:hypothetical protein
MTFRQLFLLAIVLYFATTSGASAADRLPGVSPRMETPEFWTKKVKSPNQPLLRSEEIEKMNEENLNRQDLYLWRIKDLKEEWNREEILAQLKEDWEGFESTGNGNPSREPFFWNDVKKNLNPEGLGEKNRMLFALVVKRADIRFFPTDQAFTSIHAEDGFDRLQHSSVSPGSLVGVYHFSKDGLWAYVQTQFVRGWVHAADLSIAKDRSEAVAYEEAADRLAVTGSSVTAFDDPSFRQPIFSAQMGSSFPFLGSDRYHVVKIPFREANGRMAFRKGYIPPDADVHRGFLPYTQKNLATQAFKMLHQPYAWGERSGGRDCSRFIMDLFASFGIVMPRNSMYQAKVGIPFSGVEAKTMNEKQQILDRAPPLATTIRLPGHIMLYLGRNGGRYYVIHSIWGISRNGKSGPIFQKIGRVVVSDLSLGEPDQSLLHRSTDIQVIASPSWVRNSP